jgi:AP2 domain
MKVFSRVLSGRWEARIGVPGSKHIYLGLFHTEEEAARAYDAALVRLRGSAAATNFALSDYRTDLAAYHKMQQVTYKYHRPCDCCLHVALASKVHCACCSYG